MAAGQELYSTVCCNVLRPCPVASPTRRTYLDQCADARAHVVGFGRVEDVIKFVRSVTPFEPHPDQIARRCRRSLSCNQLSYPQAARGHRFLPVQASNTRRHPKQKGFVSYNVVAL